MQIPSFHRRVWLAALILLALSQAACNYAAQLMNTGPTPISSTPQPANCENKYLMAKKGFTKTFKESTGNTYKITISDLGPDSFNQDALTTTADGQKTSSTYFWKCNPAGLIMIGSDVEMFSSQTGLTVPASIKIGDQWTSHYETSYATFTENNTVVGEESVTVPAGTFTATKIQTSSISQGKSANNPFTLKTNGFTWWAAGIGSIKSSLTFTTKTTTSKKENQLISYQTP